MRIFVALLACALAACSIPLSDPPIATSLSPDHGPTGGGNLVTITGSNLAGTTEVLFGSTPSPSVGVTSDTSITAVAPAGTGGAYVIVFNKTGGSVPLEYLYGKAPSLLDLDPTHGPVGTTVTLFGGGFTGAKQALFGSTPATSFSITSDKQISVVAPAGSGAVSVTVTNEFGGSNGVGFGYDAAAPTLTTITPTVGPEAGGTQVTFTGTNLGGASAVSFGGVAATSVQILSETQVTASAPAGTGSVQVTLTTPSGTSNAVSYQYVPPMPTITTLAPMHGAQAGGTTVTISGANLASTTSVTFDGDAATFTASATSITATTPPHGSGAVDVVVTTPDGFATAAGAFTYDADATLTGVTPNSGSVAGGTSITITGTSLTGITSLTIGGVAATNVVVTSDTTLTANTPAYASGPLLSDVVATTPDGDATLAGGFAYAEVAPTLASITPSTGSMNGGTSVALAGTGFTPDTTVTIGGVAATMTAQSATSITATTPAYVSGSLTKDVTVTNAVDSATLTSGFTYTVVAPTLTSITPSTGDTSGGTSVAIVGSGFAPSTTVTIGGIAATNVVVNNSGSLSALVPAYVSGSLVKDVSVNNGVGTATLAGGFTYTM